MEGSIKDIVECVARVARNYGLINMTEIIKPYKKEKEGHLQRLPVKHVNQYNVHIEEQLITPRQKTNAIIHHGALDEVPLDPGCGVKRAFSPTNPFIKKMMENAETRND